jgi:hypothetical protein
MSRIADVGTWESHEPCRQLSCFGIEHLTADEEDEFVIILNGA